MTQSKVKKTFEFKEYKDNYIYFSLKI